MLGCHPPFTCVKTPFAYIKKILPPPVEKKTPSLETNLNPHSLTLKIFWSPLWPTENETGPHIDHPKKFWSSPSETDGPPPGKKKNNNSLTYIYV